MADEQYIPLSVARSYAPKAYDYTELTDDVRQNINKLAEAIKTKGYVVDMTEAISVAILLTYDTLALENNDALAEVVRARGSFSNLSERLNNLSVEDINKNLGKLDQSFMTDELLQQMAGNTPVNATPPDEGVTTTKLADKAVTYEKQDVVSVDDDGYLILRTVTDVSNMYVNEWINHFRGDWTIVDSERSVIAPIRKNARVKIETIGEHDRFTVATSQYGSAASANNVFRSIHVNGTDGVNEGNETYEFVNDDDTYIIIGISTGNQKPVVKITQTFEEGTKRTVNHLTEGFPKLKNEVVNSDFSNGTANWSAVGASFETIGSVGKMTATTTYGDVRQTLGERTQGNKIYVSVDVKSTSSRVGLTLNGSSLPIPQAKSKGNGRFEKLSFIIDAPVTSSNWYVGVVDTRQSGWNEIEFKNFIVMDLTKLYGKNNEPSLTEIDFIVDNYLGGSLSGSVENYVTLKKISDTKRSNSTSTVASGDTGITKTKEVYPVLYSVKTTNALDGESADSPRPIGWLYYHPETLDFYYASGSPKNMRYLFTWDKSITWDGSREPDWYRAAITKDGDVIFVYRGDRHGLGTDNPDSRQNPIIYPANDWDNPVVVDMGSGFKPTSWQMNIGSEYVYNQDYFIFAEYTRPHHKTCNVWKVTKPFTDPNNWNTVLTYELSGSNQTGMKHFHGMEYDPYSKRLYTSTGDMEEAAMILSSSDDGNTWVIETSGQQRDRTANLIFTKDQVLWANDDGNQGFYSVERDSNGVPDFSTITEEYKFTNVPPSYANILIDKPHGVLIIRRFDGFVDSAIPIHFWDIESQTMNLIAEIEPLDTATEAWGFRFEALNHYQARGDGRIVVGFMDPPNDMALLNNTSTNRINNLVLQVVKNGTEYKLDISAIADRS